MLLYYSQHSVVLAFEVFSHISERDMLVGFSIAKEVRFFSTPKIEKLGSLAGAVGREADAQDSGSQRLERAVRNIIKTMCGISTKLRRQGVDICSNSK